MLVTTISMVIIFVLPVNVTRKQMQQLSGINDY